METTFEFISCWLAAALMPCQSVTVLIRSVSFLRRKAERTGCGASDR
jgi:hypothetical protein